MLHAAELERRDEQEIELAERIRNAGVLLHPVERRGVQIEDRVAVPRDLLRVGFAVEHPERAAVALGPLHRKPAGREREQIRGDRLRLGEGDPRSPVERFARDLRAVGERLPSHRHLERQRPARFEIRLVEAGKGLVRACGDENRVEEVVVAVERRVAGVEIDGHRVVADLQR